MLCQREIPVRYDVDVFVAGGGSSGGCAAVSAAKLGKRVFPAKNVGCFGGMGASSNPTALTNATSRGACSKANKMSENTGTSTANM